MRTPTHVNTQCKPQIAQKTLGDAQRVTHIFIAHAGIEDTAGNKVMILSSWITHFSGETGRM